VFDNLGSTFVLSAYTQTTTNKWGDETASYGAGASVVAVPWNDVSNSTSYQPFGDLQEGQVDMAFKYDQTINVKDILYSGTLVSSYEVKEVEQFPLADGILVKVVRLSKKLF
jgi:hypothetical protein